MTKNKSEMSYSDIFDTIDLGRNFLLLNKSKSIERRWPICNAIAVPPTTGSETITQETSTGIYRIMEKKDLGSTAPALRSINAQSDINQAKYENNGKIPL